MIKKIEYIKSIIFHLLLVFLIIMVFNNTMKLTAFSPYKRSEPPFLSHFLQQGWKFFTKNPREDVLKIYTISNGHLRNYITPNNSIHNYFGINRKSRKLGAELSVIKDMVPKKEWISQKGIESDFKKLNAYKVKRNNFIEVMPNGIYILVESKIIPWQWINTVNINSIPLKFVKIQIND